MFGATNPTGHAEGTEPHQRDLEERMGPLAVAGVSPARVHQRLVVVDDRAHRTRALLVEHGARLREPLGRFIEAHNRAGVPLYLWYAPGAADARVLPQVLTPGTLAALPAS